MKSLIKINLERCMASQEKNIEAVSEENRRLWALARATSILFSHRASRSLSCARALELALELSSTTRGMLLIFNQDSGLFELESSQGLSNEQVESYMEMPVFDREYPELLEALRHEAGPMLKSHPLLAQLFPEDGPEAVYVLPLQSEEDLEGMLLLAGGDVAQQPSIVLVARIFAQRVHAAVSTAYLFEQLRGKTEALEAATITLVETEKLALAGQMSGTVAHQLRNPLSVISASVQLLMQDQDEASDAYKAMDLVCQKVADMDATIGVLQELAKPLNLQLRPIGVGTSLTTIQRFIAPRCHSQGVELALGVPSDLPPIWMDENKFQRCLLDLCVNSLQELPHGGRLVLAAARFGTRLEVRVEDNGPGIPPELLPKLFEPFFSTKARGSGLGLYNVKRVADAMGVALEVHNVEPHGASFRFSFPITQEKPQPILTLASRQEPREPRP